MRENDRDTKMIDRPPTWALAVGIVVFFAAVYAVTAEWTDAEVNVDAVAAALPAWSLVENRTLSLPAGALVNPWVVRNRLGNLSNRPPGISLVAVPGYLVARSSEFTNSPATATAVLLTASAMGVLFLTLTRVVPVSSALVAVAIVGFGTATWPISSAQLWPHGVGQFTAAVGVFGLATERYLLSGLAYAFGILVRPPTALFALATGIGKSMTSTEGKLRPLLEIGIPSTVGLILLAFYNDYFFGQFGLTGAYSPQFAENLMGMAWDEYLSNLLATLTLPRNGFLVWSPVVLVALVAVPVAWKRAPDWARISFVAGVLYVLVHARLNRASGGLAFNYRYPLEPLMMMATMLCIAANELMVRSRRTRVVLIASGAVSVVLQGLYVFTLTCEATAGSYLCSLGV